MASVFVRCLICLQTPTQGVLGGILSGIRSEANQTLAGLQPLFLWWGVGADLQKGTDQPNRQTGGFGVDLL